MKTTYWKGDNLGPNRMEFMCKSLRLKQFELPTEEEVAEVVDMSLQPIDITGHDAESIDALEMEHDAKVRDITKAILSKLKGE